MLLKKTTRHYFRVKTIQEWFLDGSNLIFQGQIVPILQIIIVFNGLNYLLPKYHQVLDISFTISFIINLIFIDYLYYWNHRLFHHKKLFPLHVVHHTATKMDVFVTSRNTIWTSLLIIYMWSNGVFIFLLKDPSGYLTAMALTAALDCWRHSEVFTPKLQNIFSKYFFIVTPIDHAWHHSSAPNYNYGANFNLFDKLHSTFVYHNDYPEKLGIKVKYNLWQKLFFPYRLK
jgi:sterol desaturase/sphingolipid hydroxylase (fatty acid hydroxylase superfamily)